MNFFKKNKLLVIFFTVVLGGVFTKNVMAKEALSIGDACSTSSQCTSGYCNAEHWCVSKQSNCYSTMISGEVPTTNYVCDGGGTKYTCSGGVFVSAATNGCTAADSTTSPNAPSGSDSGSSDEAVIPSYPDSIGTGVINLKSGTVTIGGILSKLLPYIFTIAGLILLVILIFGGMGLMTAAGDPKKIEAAKGRITMAFVGFLIVFASYFIAQIVQVMLGVNFLG